MSADIIETDGTVSGEFGTINNNSPVLASIYKSSNNTLSVVTLDTDAFNSQLQSSVNSSILFNDTLTSQIANDAFAEDSTFWVKSLYRNRSIDVNSKNQSGLSDNSYGLALGAQTNIGDSYKLGFSLAKITSDMDLEQNGGSRSGDSVFASVHGTYNRSIANNSKFFTSLSLGVGYHENTSKRLVSNNSVSSYAESDSNDIDLSATLQTGAQFNLANQWYITPKVSASYIKTNGGGFTENSGGAAAVSINDFTFDTFKFRESVRLGKDSALSVFNGVKISPYFELGLSQERNSGNRDIAGSFKNGAKFNTTLQDQRANFVTSALGLNIDITQDVSAFLNYENSISKNEKRDDAQAGLKFKF
jgi:hypothetical protein